MTATQNQTRPKLQINQGTPVTIALQYPSGIRVPSRYPNQPDQVYYTLTSGEGVYLDLQVAQQITALRLKPGELFTLLKQDTRNWTVERGAGAEGRRNTIAPATARVSESRAVENEYTPAVNGAGEAHPQILKRCYQDAVEIALGAVEFARGKGLTMAPTFEDVRCIASVLCIAETGGRR